MSTVTAAGWSTDGRPVRDVPDDGCLPLAVLGTGGIVTCCVGDCSPGPTTDGGWPTGDRSARAKLSARDVLLLSSIRTTSQPP